MVTPSCFGAYEYVSPLQGTGANAEAAAVNPGLRPARRPNRYEASASGGAVAESEITP
jgi:hypothetical protein